MLPTRRSDFCGFSITLFALRPSAGQGLDLEHELGISYLDCGSFESHSRLCTGLRSVWRSVGSEFCDGRYTFLLVKEEPAGRGFMRLWSYAKVRLFCRCLREEREFYAELRSL